MVSRDDRQPAPELDQLSDEELMEEIVRDNGNVINPNLADYKLPAAADLPTMATMFVQIEG